MKILWVERKRFAKEKAVVSHRLLVIELTYLEIMLIYQKVSGCAIYFRFYSVLFVLFSNFYSLSHFYHNFTHIIPDKA